MKYLRIILGVVLILSLISSAMLEIMISNSSITNATSGNQYDLSNSCFTYDNVTYSQGGYGAAWWNSDGGGVYPYSDPWIISGAENIDCGIVTVPQMGNMTVYYEHSQKQILIDYCVAQGITINAYAEDLFTPVSGIYTYQGNPSGWVVSQGYIDPPYLSIVLDYAYQLSPSTFTYDSTVFDNALMYRNGDAGLGIYAIGNAPWLDLSGSVDVDVGLYQITDGQYSGMTMTIYYAHGSQGDMESLLTSGYGNFSCYAESDSIFTSNGAGYDYTYAGDPSDWSVYNGDNPPYLVCRPDCFVYQGNPAGWTMYDNASEPMLTLSSDDGYVLSDTAYTYNGSDYAMNTLYNSGGAYVSTNPQSLLQGGRLDAVLCNVTSGGDVWNTLGAWVEHGQESNFLSYLLDTAGYVDAVVDAYADEMFYYCNETPLTVTTTSLPDTYIYTSYPYSINASGGYPPYTWAVNPSDLPWHIILDSSTGIFSGITSMEFGMFNFSINVTDSYGSGVTNNYSIDVTPWPGLNIVYTGDPSGWTQVIGGISPPVTYSVGGGNYMLSDAAYTYNQTDYTMAVMGFNHSIDALDDMNFSQSDTLNMDCGLFSTNYMNSGVYFYTTIWYPDGQISEVEEFLSAYMYGDTHCDASATGLFAFVPVPDINGDGHTNVLDMIDIGQTWGETGYDGWIPEDINGDGSINVLDMILVGQNWTS